jgi:hypothetical protein
LSARNVRVGTSSSTRSRVADSGLMLAIAAGRERFAPRRA